MIIPHSEEEQSLMEDVGALVYLVGAVKSKECEMHWCELTAVEVVGGVHVVLSCMSESCASSVDDEIASEDCESDW